MCVCVCVTESLCHTAVINTKQCKSTILQLKHCPFYSLRMWT